jgi:hypothetical protein
LVSFFNPGYSQEEYPALEEQLELESANAEELVEDDSWFEQLSSLKQHPVNLNKASEAELSQLLILSPIQISNLLRYRSLLGKLIHVNELQAVPGWTPDLIRKLVPFITISDHSISSKKILTSMKNANLLFLIRATQQFIKQEPDNYLGSPQNLLIKLQFNNGRSFQSGLLLEKDAGEPWFVKTGFDFTSFHFFARDVGIIKAFAVGDFQVNMGQGLIQWQGMATKKSASVLMTKKQDAVIKPYRSAGELNFHRGIGIAIGKHKWGFMTYASIRKLSANAVEDVLLGASVSSIARSGYHRTANEMSDRNMLKQISTGAVVSYAIPNGGVAANFVNFNYSLPLVEKQEPYQMFALSGRTATNYSIDYSYTLRNVHFFGEFAVDKKLNKAWLCGLLASLDKQLDLSLVFRSIAHSFTSINGIAFTENSSPNNETGLYTGLSFRISSRWQISAYADFFYSPWLKYRVDAPSIGNDFLMQCNWTPNKRLTMYGRWKLETKEENISPGVGQRHRKSFRAHLSWDCSRSLLLRQRWETSYYKIGSTSERGTLLYTDIILHPPFKPCDFSARLLLFETGGYNSRIYAFEKNVLNGFSVPFFSGSGLHTAINFHVDLKTALGAPFLKSHDLGFWMSLGYTAYALQSANAATNNQSNILNVRVQLILR